MSSGGNIYVHAHSLTATNLSTVQAVTLGQGNAGNVTIDARDRIVFQGGSEDGLRSGVVSQAGKHAVGSGGNIEITTGSLLLKNRAWLNTSTLGRGDAGSININARDTISFDDSSALSVIDEQAVGNGGNIYVNTGSLYLTNGSQLDTSVFSLGRGNAGNIIVNARDTISLDGTSPDGVRASTLFSEVVKGAVGNGGNVEVTTGSLFATNGGRLEASTEGQGNAGNVIINARDIVRFDGTSRDGRLSSGALSNVVGNAVGTGGNVEITAGSLFVANGAQVDASTEGLGSAGNIIINARESIVIDGFRDRDVGRDKSGVFIINIFSSGIFSDVGKDANGNGGDIRMTTGSLSLTNGARLDTSTSGKGNAGNAIVNVRDLVNLGGSGFRGLFSTGILSNVTQGATGSGGNIEITAGSFSLTSGGLMVTSTSGEGNAGDIIINARDNVSFADNASSSVRQGAKGQGGDIRITTSSLSVIDGAQLLTITSGQGSAGNIIINARDNISFRGTDSDSLSSGGALSRVNKGGIGLGGDIRITTGFLSLTNGAQLDASTLAGQGDAGNIFINARDAVLVDGFGRNNGFPSAIFTDTGVTAKGRGGIIDINTSLFRVANGAVVNARTTNSERGGDIIINANTLESINGGQILTTTLNSGQAGNITLSVTNNITIFGSDPNIQERRNRFPNRIANEENGESGLFANTRLNSTGNGGKINLQTRLLSLSDRAQISARSLGSGTAGDVTITADESVTLTNSDITTSAQQASGGAISLTAKTMRLYGDSDIRTNVENGINNGGNITLNANSIIAFDDSDILAFARDGRGGNVFLDTPAFFGENYQPAPVGTNPNTLDGNNRVDINASGGISSGIINTPDTSFIQNNLSELSQTPIDTNALIANSCIGRNFNKLEGSFTITGLGGLPNRPGDVSLSTYSTGDVRSVQGDRASNLWHKGDPIVEPQGVYKLPSGQLVLSRECR
jgi:large exoprotein involved in heme utilization and adhesion